MGNIRGSVRILRREDDNGWTVLSKVQYYKHGNDVMKSTNLFTEILKVIYRNIYIYREKYTYA